MKPIHIADLLNARKVCAPPPSLLVQGMDELKVAWSKVVAWSLSCFINCSAALQDASYLGKGITPDQARKGVEADAESANSEARSSSLIFAYGTEYSAC